MEKQSNQPIEALMVDSVENSESNLIDMSHLFLVSFVEAFTLISVRNLLLLLTVNNNLLLKVEVLCVLRVCMFLRSALTLI